MFMSEVFLYTNIDSLASSLLSLCSPLGKKNTS